MYSNTLNPVAPIVPSSPTLVTTGVGAYTQTINTSLNCFTLTLQAGLMGTNGLMTANYIFTNNNSANQKQFLPFAGAFGTGGVNPSNTTSTSYVGVATAQNITASLQTTASTGLSSVAPTTSTSNTSGTLYMSPSQYLTNASDWIILQQWQLILTR